MTTRGGTPNELRKRGGQPGNCNPLTHGLRVPAVRFEFGTLPGKLKRVERSLNKFRALIEAAVADAYGEVSLLHGALIQSACRHERTAMLLHRWLRLHHETMSHSERLAYTKAIGDASTSRDKCLDRLNLTKIDEDAYSDVLREIELEGQIADPTEDNAAEGRGSDLNVTQGERRDV